MYVVEKLLYFLIIGLDFMKKYKVIINLVNNIMFFFNDVVNVFMLKLNSGIVRVVKLIILLFYLEIILCVKILNRKFGEIVLLELLDNELYNIYFLGLKCLIKFNNS